MPRKTIATQTNFALTVPYCPETDTPLATCKCHECSGTWPKETDSNRLMDSPDVYGFPMDEPHDEMDNPPGREW